MNAHGSVGLEWRNNLLIISTYGPFNIEGIERAFSDIRESVNQCDFDTWYHVDYLDENTLGSPEVMKVIGEYYCWAHENKCLKAAIVYANNLQMNMLNDFLGRIDFDIKIFDNKDMALDYITSEANEDQ